MKMIVEIELTGDFEEDLMSDEELHMYHKYNKRKILMEV